MSYFALPHLDVFSFLEVHIIMAGLTVRYSQPSISTGAASADSTNLRCYVVADVGHVVRLMMVVSVLHMYTFSACCYFLHNTV